MSNHGPVDHRSAFAMDAAEVYLRTFEGVAVGALSADSPAKFRRKNLEESKDIPILDSARDHSN